MNDKVTEGEVEVKAEVATETEVKVETEVSPEAENIEDDGITYEDEPEEESGYPKEKEPVVEQESESATENEDANGDKVTDDLAPDEIVGGVDGYQKRIDKVTKDKHEHKRRADGLQSELDRITGKSDGAPKQEPKLEDFDYDKDKHLEALVNHRTDIKVAEQETLRNDNARKATEQVAHNEYMVGVETYAKAKGITGREFLDSTANIPTLPEGIVAEIQGMDKGFEVIDHLVKNVEIADKIAGLSPLKAMREIILISNSFSKTETKATVKNNISKAPKPIETLKGGAKVTNEDDDGPPGTTYE